MCCKDKLAIFESSLNEHHAFYYEFCICISLAYGISIPFLPAFDHATITQTFLRQIGNSASGFSQAVPFCPLCTNKMFTLIQNDETKSLYSLHCIFLKNSLYFSTFWNNITVHSVLSNVAKIHSRLPAAMEFWLVCLGILAYSCQNTSRDSGV